MNRDLSDYLSEWDLEFEKTLAETFSSTIYLVRSEGKRFVLKCLKQAGIVDEKNGAKALRYFDGVAAVRLINSDCGAQLVEYVDGEHLVPMVRGGNDGMATEVMCSVLSLLHKGRAFGKSCNIDVTEFTALRERYHSLFLAAKREDASDMFRLAAREAKILLDNPQEETVLHGDMHHENVMHSSSRGWLALDPKGLYGERAYDAANILCNPCQMPELVADRARVDKQTGIICEKMGLDRTRFLKFAFTYGCLSAAWSKEDGHDPACTIRVAENVLSLIGDSK